MPENRCTGLTRLYSSLDRSDADPGGSPRRRANLGWVAGLVIALTAVSTQAQTLSDALAEAYNSNPQLLAQRALLRATDEQVPQALSFWRPQVTFNGQVGGSRSVVTSGSTGLPSVGGRSVYSTF